MKRVFLFLILAGSVTVTANAQSISSAKVPVAAKEAFAKKYPNVKNIKWEKEHGNFEGNWKENGYDHSAAFTPDGKFAASETDITPAKLPAKAKEYVMNHYHAKIKEASLNSDANGKETYEADIKGNTIIFDARGNFIKAGEAEEE